MGLLCKTRRESHVLKLVHPGGFVEIHANPLMASEVMNKNPRHCVTRPDIFRFPWIVISPESILRPGNVFFIVPCHTIRNLLKYTNTPLSFKHHHRDPSLDQDCHRGRKISNSNKIHFLASTSMSSVKQRTYREGRKQRQGGGNKAQFNASSSEYTSRDVAKLRALTPSGIIIHNSKQVPKLKSCMKKNHNAKSRNLKVRFACTDEDVNNANFTTKICDS